MILHLRDIYFPPSNSGKRRIPSIVFSARFYLLLWWAGVIAQRNRNSQSRACSRKQVWSCPQHLGESVLLRGWLVRGNGNAQYSMLAGFKDLGFWFAVSKDKGNFAKFRPGCYFKAHHFKMQILRPNSKFEPYASEKYRGGGSVWIFGAGHQTSCVFPLSSLPMCSLTWKYFWNLSLLEITTKGKSKFK